MSNYTSAYTGAQIDNAVAMRTLIGSTAPDTSTVGVVGQRYFDTVSELGYECTSASGSTYIWKLSDITATISKVGKVATITITDKNGTTTETINDGADGANGSDGISATHAWNGTVLSITSASGTTSADLKGAKGDKGDDGTPGAKGDKGNNGAQGIPGTDGRTWHVGTSAPAGTLGVAGDLYLLTSTSDIYEKTGASTWTLRLNIKGDKGDAGAKGDKGDDGSDAIIYYGTSSTASGTAAKTASITGFTSDKLVTGTIVGVKFTNANTNTSATLNVSSTGAKSIRTYNATPTTGQITAGMIAIFQYDGTYWVHINPATPTVAIANNLTTTSTGFALDATQGKVLNDNKLDKSGGTVTGNLYSNNPSPETVAVRNMYAGTDDMVAGTTALPTGVFYAMYE